MLDYFLKTDIKLTVGKNVILLKANSRILVDIIEGIAHHIASGWSFDIDTTEFYSMLRPQFSGSPISSTAF